jgi:hypothetical protein
MRLGVLVAILGEMPALRDKVCAPRETVSHRETAKAAEKRPPSAKPALSRS